MVVCGLNSSWKFWAASSPPYPLRWGYNISVQKLNWHWKVSSALPCHTAGKKWKTAEMCWLEVRDLPALRGRRKQEGELSVHRPAGEGRSSAAGQGGFAPPLLSERKGYNFLTCRVWPSAFTGQIIFFKLHLPLSWSLVPCLLDHTGKKNDLILFSSLPFDKIHLTWFSKQLQQTATERAGTAPVTSQRSKKYCTAREQHTTSFCLIFCHH